MNQYYCRLTTGAQWFRGVICPGIMSNVNNLYWYATICMQSIVILIICLYILNIFTGQYYSFAAESSSSEIIRNALRSFQCNNIIEKSSNYPRTLKLSSDFQDIESITNLVSRISQFLMWFFIYLFVIFIIYCNAYGCLWRASAAPLFS